MCVSEREGGRESVTEREKMIDRRRESIERQGDKHTDGERAQRERQTDGERERDRQTDGERESTKRERER